jgi:hypothetical protein
MLAALVSLALVVPCAQHGPGVWFPDDPNGQVTILPPTAIPKFAGGKVPVPPPHSDAVVLKGNPGFKVVSRKLDSQAFHPPRFFQLAGNARLWTLTYFYELRDENGNARSVYIDRNALVLVPVKP